MWLKYVIMFMALMGPCLAQSGSPTVNPTEMPTAIPTSLPTAVPTTSAPTASPTTTIVLSFVFYVERQHVEHLSTPEIDEIADNITADVDAVMGAGSTYSTTYRTNPGSKYVKFEVSLYSPVNETAAAIVLETTFTFTASDESTVTFVNIQEVSTAATLESSDRHWQGVVVGIFAFAISLIGIAVYIGTNG